MGKFFLILYCFCAVAIGVATAANDADKTQHELSQVRQQISQLTQHIYQHKSRRNKELKQLQKVEKSLGMKRRQLRNTRNEIAKNKQKLKKLASKQQELEQQIAKQIVILEQHLNVAYKMDSNATLKLLLNQTDPGKISRMRRYFLYLSSDRMQLIEKYNANLEQLAEVNSQIIDQNSNLLANMKTQEQHLAAINKKRRQRQLVIKDIATLLSAKDKQLATLRQNEKNLTALLEKLTNIFKDIPDLATDRPFSSLKGRLDKPIHAAASNAFGANKSGDLRWNGLMFPAPMGKKVLAIATGRVVFADWIQGFGQMIILDHNDGYLSLYGHNQELLYEVGDWVQATDNIALSGNSGGINEPALYFEIRHQGKAINPMQWLKK